MFPLVSIMEQDDTLFPFSHGLLCHSTTICNIEQFHTKNVALLVDFMLEENLQITNLEKITLRTKWVKLQLICLLAFTRRP